MSSKRKGKSRRNRARKMRGVKPFVETQEGTLQVPFGEFSVLSALQEGAVTAFEAMTQLTLGYRSNWESGKSWRTSQATLAGCLSVSRRYVRETLARLKSSEWLSVAREPCQTRATVYQLLPHKCSPAMVPTDSDGRPLSFAVPRGAGGPFERLFSGDISWKACLVWLRLKLKSDWRTGVSDAVSLRDLASSVRMGMETLSSVLKELVGAGMLKRLSESYQKSVFQLYPKPPEKKPVKRRKPASGRKERTMRAEGDWRYSHNEQYRVNVVSGDIEFKPSRKRGLWQLVRHERRHEIPLPIQRAFKLAVEVAARCRSVFGDTDSAISDTDSAISDTDSAVG